MAKKIRVAINGFGRIGRTALKAAFARPDIHSKVTFVGINDLMDTATIAHMLSYDTVFGKTPYAISAQGNTLVIDGEKIPVISEKDPTKLPWKKMQVDVVLECTGRFTNAEAAAQHLTAGAKRVIISAPAKGGVPTMILGIPSAHKKAAVVSNASCTTNCAGPVTAIIEEVFGIKKAALTTIHSVTAEQNLVDGPPPALHKDLRRARSALHNMVPTSTGAAVATTEVLPSLKGHFDGLAIRVPTLDVSLSDFTFLVKRKTTIEEVNQVLSLAAKRAPYKGIVGVSTLPLVSTDYVGSPFSAVVDLSFTNVIDGDLVKLLAWYDNEWGYSNRLMEMAVAMG